MKKTVIIFGLLVAILIGLFFFSTPPPIAIPDDVAGKFIQINSHQIRYFDSGSGMPLVFIHGFGSSIFSWRKI